MSYCVKCGVKLSAYHKECPLCNTEVIDPNRADISVNTDYPDYSANPTKVSKRANRMLTGFILSALLILSSVITLLVDIIVQHGITWSSIVCASIAFVWISAVYPLFRKRNTFFRLFTLECLYVIIYLLILNLLIIHYINWAWYPTVSVVITWIIVTGFYRPKKIKRYMPIVVYYLISFVVVFVGIAVMVGSQQIATGLILPIFLVLLILSLLLYFIIKTMVSDPIGVVMTILLYIALLCLWIDVVTNRYMMDVVNPTWSLIVFASIVPLLAVGFIIKKSRELRAYIVRKMHL